MRLLFKIWLFTKRKQINSNLFQTQCIVVKLFNYLQSTFIFPRDLLNIRRIDKCLTKGLYVLMIYNCVVQQSVPEKKLKLWSPHSCSVHLYLIDKTAIKLAR
jgi:hypothetical protein